MAVATPPTGVSNGELIRCVFAVLNDHDAAAMSAAQSDTIVERFPEVTLHGRDEVAAYFHFGVYDQMQFARQIGVLPADGAPADRVAKTAFNARTRLLARLRNRRRR